MAALAHGSCKGPFDGPAVHVKACADGSGVQSGQSRPLCNRVNLAPELKAPTGSGVVVLLGASRPIAVLGAIRAVIVSTLKGVADRTAAHVRKEGRVVVAPTFAHLDTPSAVIGVGRTAWHMASALGVLPYPVFACDLAHERIAVTAQGHAGSEPLTLQTSTRACLAQRQVAGSGNNRFSAVTQALPFCLFWWMRRTANHKQSAIALPSQVACAHGAGY